MRQGLRVSLSGPVLRDTARLSRAMGFEVSQQADIGREAPPPSMRTLGAVPPVKEWYLSESKAKTCDTPCCDDTISKRDCAIWGGASRIRPLRAQRVARGTK